MVWVFYSITPVNAQPQCPCKFNVDNTFQVAPMTQGPDVGIPPLYQNYNAATPMLPLPFHFCFYGQSYDSVSIGNKGIITFKKPVYQFDTSHLFPFGADTVMIAPFYSDGYTVNHGGVVYYKITPTYMVVIWDSIKYNGSDVDGWNTFQLIITDGQDPILPAGSNVSFCYPIMQWACSDSVGGFSGYGGAPATVGINKGNGIGYAQITITSMGGLAYYGPFSPDNGVDWLNYNSFTFNTCVTGNTIAPVIFNNPQKNKSTLYICPCDTTETQHAFGTGNHCDTVNLTGAYICAVAGQNARLSYTCNGPLNVYSVDTGTVHFIDSITVTIIPAYGDTGRKVLNLIATDPVSHLQSIVTYNVVVTVNCLDSPPPNPDGIYEPTFDDSFSVYPNPANKRITVKLNDVTGASTVKIYSVLGDEILSVKLVSDVNDIDVSGLSKGIYFIRIYKENKPLPVRRVIIE